MTSRIREEKLYVAKAVPIIIVMAIVNYYWRPFSWELRSADTFIKMLFSCRAVDI